MKRPLLVFLIFAVAALAPVLSFASETLTILHVNDYHGRIFPSREKSVDGAEPSGGAAYLAEMIAEQRRLNPDGTLLLAAGDMFQGTPVSNIFKGTPVLEIMNLLLFDAMVPGNHEFDWGKKTLAALMAEASFPFVCANVLGKDGHLLEGTVPFVLLERKGVKIAVVGLATPETIYTTKAENVADLTFLDPRAVLPAVIHKVRQKGAVIVILLTHLGLDEDRKLARAVPGIDIIVGGHTHTVVMDPVAAGKTIVTQAGYNGLYLGVLEVTVDEKTGVVEKATRKGALKRVSAGTGAKYAPGVARIADGYGRIIKDRFQRVVGESRVNLVRIPAEGVLLGDMVTDCMKEASGADIAIQNSGGVRTDIPAGKITLEQIYTVLPFDNQLVTLELQGTDVVALFRRMLTEKRDLLHVAGMKVVCAKGLKGDVDFEEISVKGEPVDPERYYLVATSDFLASGGDGFREFLKGRNLSIRGEVRDAFIDYIKNRSPLSPSSERSIIFPGR